MHTFATACSIPVFINAEGNILCFPTGLALGLTLTVLLFHFLFYCRALITLIVVLEPIRWDQ